MKDKGQYSSESIADYESVWGEGFVSPGGATLARELIASMDLASGELVLDVGAGLGGSAFLMAQEFGLQVEGIDLSERMVELSKLRCRELGLEDRVTLEPGNCLQLSVSNRYQAVYSRDVFLHVSDKARLFRTLFQILTPGGGLLFTDYCCQERPWSKAFRDYVLGRGYALCSVDGYEESLSKAGFRDVLAIDITERFVETLEADLRQLERLGAKEHLKVSWEAKLERARRGEQRWGLFRATKPD